MISMPGEVKTILTFTPFITGASVETMLIARSRHLW